MHDYSELNLELTHEELDRMRGIVSGDSYDEKADLEAMDLLRGIYARITLGSVNMCIKHRVEKIETYSEEDQMSYSYCTECTSEWDDRIEDDDPNMPILNLTDEKRHVLMLGVPGYTGGDTSDMESFLIEQFDGDEVNEANFGEVVKRFRAWYKETAPDEYISEWQRMPAVPAIEVA